ncbi:MAG: Bug family tripartite tricarboxylate transporter substrate binding protein [Burkholderiales bacterium]
MLLLAAVAAVAVSPRPHAQGLLERPIRIIVPVPAGGTSDIAARLIAERIGVSLGRPIVVENRVGATGRLAAKTLKSAAPDGATLLLTPMAVPVIVPLVFRRPGYDPAKDFAPVAQIATYQFAIAIAPDLPVRNVPEFTAWAKAHPDRANFGTLAVGSLPHFLGTMIEQEARVGLVHVPYGSLAQLKTELMSGTLPSGISALSDFVELHRAGRVRIIGTSGARRSLFLPEVPTLVEQGYSEAEGTGWNAVFAPAGTPQAEIDQLASAIVAAVRSPEVGERFKDLGFEPTGTTPQELARIIAADTTRWRKIIEASGFVAE